MSSTKTRVIMMGTPEFAIPTLRALHECDNIEVVLVVTQPDKPVGRKKVLTPPPLKEAAVELEIPVFQPEKVRTETSLLRLAESVPDVFVTAAYGQILPQKLLDMAPFGCLNVHASLLPRWRGAAPIHRAIIAGDKETGVTIMRTVKELDAGPVLGSVSVPIEESDNVESLHDRLAGDGAALLVRLLPQYVSGVLVPEPQPEVGITYAHRILREDEWVDWHAGTETVYNHIRGLSPWPGASTLFNGQTVKVWSCDKVNVGGEQDIQACAPGTCVLSSAGDALVRVGDGWLRLLDIQPAGKRRMSASEWFRGQRSDSVMFRREGSEA